jgi:hypothetical protein
MAFGPLPGVETPPNTLMWLVLSNLCVAGVLAWYARRSSWTGWPLAAALFVVSYGIGIFNSLIEAYVFNLFGRPGEFQALAVRSLVPALLFPPLLVWLAGRWNRPGSAPATAPPYSTAGWIARVAACSFAYLVLYFAAGMIIFPYVQQFYTERPIPAPLTIVALQLLVRGPIFAGIGLLITRIAPATRGEHAVMVAVAMCVLGGVAPLMVPNAYFPDAVRWVHFAEVVTSNFIFGAIVGWLLGGSRRMREQGVVAHAA